MSNGPMDSLCTDPSQITDVDLIRAKIRRTLRREFQAVHGRAPAGREDGLLDIACTAATCILWFDTLTNRGGLLSSEQVRGYELAQSEIIATSASLGIRVYPPREMHGAPH